MKKRVNKDYICIKILLSSYFIIRLILFISNSQAETIAGTSNRTSTSGKPEKPGDGVINGGMEVGTIVGITVGVILGVVIIFGGAFYLIKKNHMSNKGRNNNNNNNNNNKATEKTTEEPNSNELNDINGKDNPFFDSSYDPYRIKPLEKKKPSVVNNQESVNL